MIRLDQLHEDQLEMIRLAWTPLSELYAEADLEDVDGSLEVLTFDGRYVLDQIIIAELGRLINSGGTRDQMVCLLEEFVLDLEDSEWLDTVEAIPAGGDDMHTWREPRTGGGGYALG